MKVTFCAYDRPDYVGGPNAGLVRLLPELKRRGVEVGCLFLVFGARHELPAVRALEAAGVPCRIAPYHATTELRVRWLLGQVRENPPDVFVPNLMPAAYFASRWCREAGIATVGVLRSVDAFHEGFLEEFGAGALFRQSAFVGVSRRAVEMIRHAAPDVRRVVQIPSPVIVPPESVKHKIPLRVMYSGRLVQRNKRIDLVARLFCRCARELPETQWSIYGHGPDRGLVEQIIHKQGQGLPVQYAGRVEAWGMPRHIARHHCLVLLSEYEGMPLAMMEAMAAGLAPVAMRGCSGVDELVEHEHTGLLLEDPEKDLPRAVERLRDDPALFEKLSANARERVRGFSSLPVVADAWLRLFQDILETEGPRRRVRMPLFLELPPLNPKVAPEDDRATIRGRLVAWSAARRPAFLHGEKAPFLSPRCTPSHIDTCTLRRGILRGLQRNLHHFRGLVADIGAGCAPYKQLVLDVPAVTGYLAVDLQGSLYRQPDLFWDGQRLPLRDGSAGSVLATEVLEHCEAPERFLAECWRVLAPGGACLLTMPFLWPLHDIPHDAFRYTPWTLERLLRSAGFDSVEITPTGGYDAAMAQMLGLYIRRRSRSRFYIRFLRPLLSLAAVPLVASLRALDTPPQTWREGLMVTGLCALAFKETP